MLFRNKLIIIMIIIIMIIIIIIIMNNADCGTRVRVDEKLTKAFFLFFLFIASSGKLTLTPTV